MPQSSEQELTTPQCQPAAASSTGRTLQGFLRGRLENRIKECQGDLFADRTSAATMRANQLRLWFAAMAYVLLCALRRIGLSHTALAVATCGTIRLKLLKIGALVRISARRVKVAMASACPAASEWRLAHARLIIAARAPPASPAQPPAPPACPAEPQATQAASPSAHGDFAHHPEHPLTALSGAARHHAVVKNT